MIRFGADKKASLPTLIPGTPEEPELRPRSARSRKKQNGKGDQLERLTSNDEETAAVNAAWRWRFNRRWRTEQVIQHRWLCKQHTSRWHAIQSMALKVPLWLYLIHL